MQKDRTCLFMFRFLVHKLLKCYIGVVEQQQKTLAFSYVRLRIVFGFVWKDHVVSHFSRTFFKSLIGFVFLVTAFFKHFVSFVSNTT